MTSRGSSSAVFAHSATWGRRGAWAGAMFAILGLFGCGPSVESIVEMRSLRDPDRAAEEQKDLLECFTDPDKNDSDWARKPHWRAEALRTLAVNDVRFEFARRHADLHKTLVSVLRAELRRTARAAPGSEDRGVHAWCVWAIARVEQGQVDELLLDALHDDLRSGDGRYRVARAALDGLAGRTDALRCQPNLHRRLLAELGFLSARMERTPVARGAARGLRSSLAYFREHLAGWRGVVDLLDSPASREMEDAALAEVIAWNHARLEAGDHRLPGAEDTWRRNVRVLLGLARGSSPGARRAARTTLARFAPAELAVALAETLGTQDDLDETDAVHLVNVLPDADRAARADADYLAARGKALETVFARWTTLDAPARERVSARLADHDPAALADGLIRATPATLGESSDDVRRHVRHLALALRRLADRDRPTGRCAEAMASLVAHPDARVRRQIAGHLLADHPDELLDGARRACRTIDREEPAPAAALVDVSVLALDAVDRAGTRAGDEPLLAALRRREIPLLGVAATALVCRDADATLVALAAAIDADLRNGSGVDIRRFALLGDLAEPRWRGLAGPTRAAVAATWRRGLGGPEETALLCCRHLLATGTDVDEDRSPPLPPSARVLIRAARADGEMAERTGKEPPR